MEVDGYTEVCATSTSKGIGEVFTTNVTVDNVANLTQLVKLSDDSLDFSVNSTNPSQTECFNISVDFGVDDICEYFNCSEMQLQLNFVVLEQMARVHVSRPSPTVTINLPSRCEMLCSLSDATSTTPQTNDNAGTIIAAIVFSIVLLITIAAIVVVSLLYCRRNRNNKSPDLEDYSYSGGLSVSDHSYVSLDVRKRSYLSEQLKQQLKDQRMIYSKSELQLTSTVGQGDVFDQLSGIAPSQKLLFQGSREWCTRDI
jgi:hypothetical protein